MFQEPYIAKIQYLYSGCQVFRHFLSIAKTIFLIAFTILKIAFAIRQECRPVISISISVCFHRLCRMEKCNKKSYIIIYNNIKIIFTIFIG